MLASKLKPYKNGSNIGITSINEIIKRIEYSAKLISGNVPIAGNKITLEKTPFGIIINGKTSIPGVNDWAGVISYTNLEIIVYFQGNIIQIPSTKIYKTFGSSQGSLNITGMYDKNICGFFNTQQGSKTNTIGFIYDFIKNSIKYFNNPSGTSANNITTILGIYKNNYYGTTYDDINFGTYYFTNLASYASNGPYFIYINNLFDSNFVGYRKYIPVSGPTIENGWINGQNIYYPNGTNTRFTAIDSQKTIFGYYDSPYQTFYYKNNAFFVPQESIVKASTIGTKTLYISNLSAKYVGLQIDGDPKYPYPGQPGYYFYNYIENKIVKITMPKGYDSIVLLDKSI